MNAKTDMTSESEPKTPLTAVGPEAAGAEGKNGADLTAAEVALANFGFSPLGGEPIDDIESVEWAFDLLQSAMDSTAGQELAAARRDGRISADEYRHGIVRIMREAEEAKREG